MPILSKKPRGPSISAPVFNQTKATGTGQFRRRSQRPPQVVKMADYLNHAKGLKGRPVRSVFKTSLNRIKAQSFLCIGHHPAVWLKPRRDPAQIGQSGLHKACCGTHVQRTTRCCVSRQQRPVSAPLCAQQISFHKVIVISVATAKEVGIAIDSRDVIVAKRIRREPMMT